MGQQFAITLAHLITTSSLVLLLAVATSEAVGTNPIRRSSTGGPNKNLKLSSKVDMETGTKYPAYSLEFSRNISTVLENLLQDYDSKQRPGDGGPPTVITTNFHIRSMGPMSELEMEYSLDCYFRQKWTDRRLQFEGPILSLSLNIKMLDLIWKPDTYFHNGKGSYLHTITRPNKFLRIYQNGEVMYSMRLTIKARCPMQLHHFPMDMQSCPLILGSYGYPVSQMVYRWDVNNPVGLKEGLMLSQFDLIDYPCRNGTVKFKRGEYSMLQVNFNLRRHTGYFLIQVYVPCTLIVVLSWVSFWINREATADRVGLGITTVLTLSTFGLDTRTDLPRVSYPTALDWFVIMCFLFVSSTLLEFASVHYFTKVGSGEVPPLEIFPESTAEDSVTDIRVISHSGAQIQNANPSQVYDKKPPVFVKPRRKPSVVATPPYLNSTKRRQHSCCVQFMHCIMSNEKFKEEMRKRVQPHGAANSVSKIDKVSRILFPFSFIVLNLFYWFLFGRSEQKITPWEER